MQLFDNLAAVGLTTDVLQIVIISAIVIFLVGMFWRYIIIGVGLVFCVAVFAMPSKKVDKPTEVAVAPIVIEEPKLQEVKPQPEMKMPPDQEMFIEDCKLYGGLSQSECTALWHDRENNMEAVKWRKKWKKDYMIKVQNARI
jgi:cell division protein FtsW (lipid II flippase)